MVQQDNPWCTRRNESPVEALGRTSSQGPKEIGGCEYLGATILLRTEHPATRPSNRNRPPEIYCIEGILEVSETFEDSKEVGRGIRILQLEVFDKPSSGGQVIRC